MRTNELVAEEVKAETPPTTIDPLEYYESVGPDYSAWSKNFNMHFGFWRPWINPFNREAMLDEANQQVFKRLFWDDQVSDEVLDLGCGLGATMRSAARSYPSLKCRGVTIVPWQIEEGRKLTAAAGLSEQVTFELMNYNNLSYPSSSVKACYAIESLVHAEGSDKREVIREIARVMKPGGRVVVYDCFLKKPSKNLPWLLQYCYKRACRGWAVKAMAEISLFVAALESNGFKDVRCEEISWSVAPSVTHVPWVSLRYLFLKILKGQDLSRASFNHVISCLLACVLGLARKSFGYYLISAVREWPPTRRSAALPDQPH